MVLVTIPTRANSPALAGEPVIARMTSGYATYAASLPSAENVPPTHSS